MAAELDVVDVGRRAILEDQDQLVLGAVEGSHAAVRLVPDAEVLECAQRRSLAACEMCSWDVL